MALSFHFDAVDEAKYEIKTVFATYPIHMNGAAVAYGRHPQQGQNVRSEALCDAFVRFCREFWGTRQ